MPKFLKVSKTLKNGKVKTKQIRSDDLADHRSEGWKLSGDVRVKKEFGQEETVDAQEMVALASEGQLEGLVSQEEITRRRGREAKEAAFADEGIETFGQSALNTLTLGAAAPALRRLSGFVEDDPGSVKARREVNPGAALAGDITGTVVGVLGGGPLGLAGKAATRAGRAVGGGLKGATVAGIVDGAVFSGAQTLADASIMDEPINAEKIISSMSSGALYGGAIGGTLHKVHSVAKAAGKAATKPFQLTDDVIKSVGSTKKVLNQPADVFANRGLRATNPGQATGNIPIFESGAIQTLQRKHPNIEILKTGFLDDLGQPTKAALDVEKLTGLPVEAVTKQNEVLAQVWAANAIAKQTVNTAAGKTGSLVDTLTKHTPAVVRDAANTVGAVKNRVTKGVARFVAAAGKPRRGNVPAAASILSKVSFDSESPPRSTKNTRRQDFLRIRAEIKGLGENPGKLRSQVGKALTTIGTMKPGLSAAMHTKAIQRLEYLNKVLPGPRGTTGFAPDRWVPSNTEVDKFARILRAAEDPGSLIDDLNTGRLTQEAVDTVKALYPEMYNEMRLEIVEHIDGIRENVGWQGRLQLGIMFQVPTDDALKPVAIHASQMSYMQRDQERDAGGQAQPSEAGSKAISNQQTATQRLGNS